MAKKQIKITLKNNDETIENSVLSIIANNTIKYSDNGITTVVKIDENKITMIRENDDYKITLVFKEKKSSNGTYFLKENNINYTLDIYTSVLEYSNSDIKIEYVLNDDTKVFLLHVEE